MSYYPHQGEEDDGDRLYSDEVFQQLISNDALLQQHDGTLTSLLQEPTPPVQQHYRHQQHQQTYTHYVQPDVMFSQTPSAQPALQPTPHPTPQHNLLEITWGSLGLEPIEFGGVVEGDGLSVVDTSTTPSVADSTQAATVPSLVPWPGRHNFRILVPTDNKDKNKWCFSADLGKLFLVSNVAVPISVFLETGQWTNAYITITPVFKQSCHRTWPVTRCFMCTEKFGGHGGAKDHVVHIEGEDAAYTTQRDRRVVTIPLRAPPPGENFSIFLLKIMCLTSCPGGANRRPYCLVMTLHDSDSNDVIGREVLDIKCCKCPARDMANEAKDIQPARAHHPQNPLEDDKITKVRKLAREIAVGQKRKRPKIKLEPGTDSRYVNIRVPVEHEAKVKAYVNSLVAQDHIRRTLPELLPFSDEETR